MRIQTLTYIVVVLRLLLLAPEQGGGCPLKEILGRTGQVEIGDRVARAGWQTLGCEALQEADRNLSSVTVTLAITPPEC